MIPLPPLKDVISALPEVYQPIFGHPEFSEAASRKGDDRFRRIMDVHDALARQLKRPVRVLDLGCAQGWFSFNLAKAGAEVLGIDHETANINVCNMLVLENRALQVRFKEMDIGKLLDFLQDDQFDLVLGLSVFHHLCHHNGKEATRELMAAIAEKIPACLFEIALASEPMHWAAGQPADPEYLIEEIAFFRTLSHHATHLSSVSRPLYFCSSRFWYLNDTLGEFSDWYDNGRGRRYFFGEEILAKLYRTVGEYGDINRYAINRAAEFLRSPPAGYCRTPHVFHSGEANGAAWLVQEKIQGSTLVEMMEEGAAYDERAILRGVLQQLAALEKIGLYHADIRVWNVLVGADGFPFLIDYNEISGNKRDCVWPDSIFLAFFIFVTEVVTRRRLESAMGRAPFISPYNLPEPYRHWGLQLWRLPPDEWRFEFLLQTLENLPMTIKDEKPDANALWMQSMERNLNNVQETVEAMGTLLKQLHAVVLADHKVLAQKFPDAVKDLEK